MKSLFLIPLVVVALKGEILDRIAIAVGQQVITELQIDEELRVTAFLNHAPIERDLTSRREAAERLIEQLLVKREMELSHYPLPSSEAVDGYYNQVRGDFASASQFDQALHAYDLSEEILRDHLALQLTATQFVDFRFRPDVEISDIDIESYYNREVTAWKVAHPGAAPPTLDASRESIRKTLIEGRTAQILETWLKERQRQFQILYLDKSLQ